MRYFPALHAFLNLSICNDVRHQASGPASIEEFFWAKAIRSGTVIKMGKIFLEIRLAVNALFEEGLGNTHMPLCEPIRGAVIP